MDVDINKVGLNDNEVLESYKKSGKNIIEEQRKTPLILKILKKFLDPMLLLLVVACVISFIIAGINYTNHSNNTVERVVPFVEASIILLIITINISLSLYQDGKSSKEMQELSKLMISESKVIRNGNLIKINSSEIVLGDLIFIEAGDKIPADAKLIESYNLLVDESILSGESTLINKSVNNESEKENILEQENMIFSGTNVINGSAKAVVTAIGKNTQVGKITSFIENEKDKLTPFQEKLNKLSKYIGIIVVIICIINFFIYILITNGTNFAQGIKNNWAESLTLSISIAIAAIPEGLLTLVMVIFASSVFMLSKQNAIVKKLSSVETLGSTSIICSDKTGTLTQNKMVVNKMWNTNIASLTDNKNDNKLLLEYATLCSNGSINFENNEYTFVGDPTETSIIKALLEIGITKNDLDKEYKRELELPFDSDRKMMTVVCYDKSINKYLVITKGAIDSILKITKDNNDIEKIQSLNNELTSTGTRVIGVSYKVIETLDFHTNEYLENEQTLLGIIGMSDPIRPEAKEAITQCKQAGIKPIMITGDHKDTAVAIAKELGIIEDNEKAITSQELNKLSEQEFNEQLTNISVYARVSPYDKIKIVKAWQAKGEIVSMTGDGVNDAPSLKAADIGCAMGITGTDVSKQAADIILTDDNFSTIVGAVKEGREVMYKIRNIIILLFTTTLTSLLTIVFGLITFGTSIFSSLQILWNNVLVETIAGFVLGKNKYNKNFMEFKPERKSTPLITKRMLIRILVFSSCITILSLLSFYLGYSVSMKTSGIQELIDNAFNIKWIWANSSLEKFHEQLTAGSYLSYLTISICLLSNTIALSTEKSIFKSQFSEIKNALIAFLISYLIIAFVSYIPYVNIVFNMAPAKKPIETFTSLGWLNILPYLFFGLLIGLHELYKFIEFKYFHYNKIISNKIVVKR